MYMKLHVLYIYTYTHVYRPRDYFVNAVRSIQNEIYKMYTYMYYPEHIK